MMKGSAVFLKRELFTILTAPPSYAMVICYLVLGALCTLTAGGFIDSNRADLNGFFAWQPWLLLPVAALLTMNQWTEEYRCGTAELLLTLPFSTGTMAVARHFAAWLLLLLALLCTLTFPLSCLWLGNPDPGPILTGYLGCALSAGLFLALGQAVACCNANPFAAFLSTTLIGLASLFAGFRPTAILLTKWGLPPMALDCLSHLSVLHYFEGFMNGAPSAGDLFFFIAGTASMLLFACSRLQRRHRLCTRAQRLFLPFAAALLLFTAVALPPALPFRVDATAGKLHTLTPGTRKILSGLPAPVTIRFLYSANIPELSANTRKHAEHIRQILADFRRCNPAKITVREENPAGNAAQSAAEGAGLAPQISSLGDMWFLGAVVSAAGSTPHPLPFLSPDNADRLEYDLLNAVLSAQHPQRQKLALLSSLNVLEHINEKELQPAWYTMQQLMTVFDIVNIPPDSPTLPRDCPPLLLVIYPEQLPSSMVDSIREHLAAGGAAIICLDPLSRVSWQGSGRYRLARPDYMDDLLTPWGVRLEHGRIAADRTLATAMTDRYRGLEQLPTLLTLAGDCLNRTSPVTASLSKLMFFCAGSLETTPVPGYTTTILARTTADSRRLQLYEAQRNASDLLTGYQPNGRPCNIAVLVDGPKARAVVVADADFLHNSLCLAPSGDNLPAAAISGNADFLLNAAQYLNGTPELLALRSRGTVQHTFTRLEKLGRQTELAIQQLAADEARTGNPRRAEIRILETKGAAATDTETARLQQLRTEENRAITALKNEQRRQLYSLRKKIDFIERTVAALNILLIPLLLTFIAGLVTLRRNS